MGLANPANFADIVFCPACSLGFFVRSRKAGQMLAEMQKAKGGRPELTGDTALPVKSQPFTLAEPASQPPLPAGFFLPAGFTCWRCIRKIVLHPPLHRKKATPSKKPRATD